jgi:hypothetical protein
MRRSFVGGESFVRRPTNRSFVARRIDRLSPDELIVRRSTN